MEVFLNASECRISTLGCGPPVKIMKNGRSPEVWILIFYKSMVGSSALQTLINDFNIAACDAAILI